MQFVHAAGARLECLDLPGDASRPQLLLLHEGLGSVSMWRDFPRRLARATGCRTVAYSREGFGRSSPRTRPFTARFMHEEAHETLPALRRALAIERPVLVGHSTGASIALLHAAHDADTVAGVIAMAPFVDVEPANLASIRDARRMYENTDWRDRLARHHDDVDAVFRAWNDTWLDPGFASWNIAPDLASLVASVVAMVGANDPYCTPAQLDRLRSATPRATRFEAIVMSDCGHAPHRECTDSVLRVAGGLLDAL